MHVYLDKLLQAHSWAEYMPFLGLAAGHPSGATPIVTRIIETLIMSMVAGAVGVYVGVEVIKNDLMYLKQGVNETNIKIERVDEKVEQIRRDLYRPIGGMNNK